MRRSKRTNLLPWFAMSVLGSGFVSAAHAQQSIIVAADGSGDQRTVQAAIDSIGDGGTARVTIRLKPGTYKERLRVERGKPPISIVGLGAKPEETVLTYDLSARSIVEPATQPVGTSGSASTTVRAADFSAENVTFANTAGQVAQAVALHVTGDRGTFRNCRFLGWQDTLCVDGGRQYFENCYIEGRVDFIFGGSTAVFDRCTIHSVNGGYVTAARTPPDSKYGYVFIDCTLTGEGEPAYLGRPWQWDRGRNAAVAFIRCRMGPHIRPEGWNAWDLKDKKNEKPETNTRYVEFGSMDLEGRPLDVSKRVPWSRQLTADEAKEYEAKNVLASRDGWYPRLAK